MTLKSEQWLVALDSHVAPAAHHRVCGACSGGQAVFSRSVEAGCTALWQVLTDFICSMAVAGTCAMDDKLKRNLQGICMYQRKKIKLVHCLGGCELQCGARHCGTASQSGALWSCSSR